MTETVIVRAIGAPGAAGAGPVWGAITGTLSSQTDLQSALDAKQASDADLTAIAALSPTNDDLLQRKAGAWTNRTPAQVKTDLVLVKGDVGLGNVDNTSDVNKPISTATQTALDLKQASDADLTAIAALSPSNDDIIQRKAGAWTNRTMVQLGADIGVPFNNTTATSAPTVNDDSGDGYAVGSRWFWPARGRAWVCLSATVGAAVWKSEGIVAGPTYVSGRYYTPDAFSRSSSAMTADRIYATLVMIRETVTIDQLAVRVGTGSAATTALMGIYSSVNSVPDTLIAQGSGSASTASNNTTATVSFSSNPVLTPGPYWLAVLFSGTPSVIGIAGSTNQSFSSVLGSATATDVFGTGGVGGATITQAYGSGLPSSFGTPTGNSFNTVHALVAFRVA